MSRHVLKGFRTAFAVIVGLLAESAVFCQSEILERNGLSIECAAVAGYGIGTGSGRGEDEPYPPFSSDDISIVDARIDLKNGNPVSEYILKKAGTTAEALNKIAGERLAAVFSELQEDPGFFKNVDVNRLQPDENTLYLLKQVRQNEAAKAARPMDYRTLNRKILLELYPKIFKQGRQVFIPLNAIVSNGDPKAVAEGRRNAVAAKTKELSCRLLGEDNKTYDLQFEKGDSSYRVKWEAGGGGKTIRLAPVKGKLPRGNFVVLGKKKDLEKVTVTWYPARKVTTSAEDADPFNARYIDLKAAQRGLRIRFKKGDPLTGLLLKKAGIREKSGIKTLTAEQIGSAMRELLPMTTMYVFVDTDIVKPYRCNYDLNMLSSDAMSQGFLRGMNRSLLLSSFPELFKFRNEFSPGQNEWLLPDKFQRNGYALRPHEIDYEGARKDLRAGLLRRDRLTLRILKENGIDEFNLKAMTEQQIRNIFAELNKMPALYRSVDYEKLGLDEDLLEFLRYDEKGGAMSEKMLKVNRAILKKMYPHLFRAPGHFVSADDSFACKNRIVYEVPDIRDYVVYETFTILNNFFFFQRSWLEGIAAISTIDAGGKKAVLAGEFIVDEPNIGHYPYAVGAVAGTVEIADKEGKEIWIVCDYHDYWSAGYSAFQYYPESRLTEKRTKLFRHQYYPISY